MIVDADAHVVESEHTWDFLDASEKKFRPQLFSSADNPNMQYWFVEGKSIGFRPPTLTEQELIALSKQTGRELKTAPEARELRDVELRLKHMDKLGIDVQILFNTMWIARVADKAEPEIALCKSWNRWMAEVWQQGNNRLRWSCVVPAMTLNEAVEQMRYAKEHGAVAVSLRPFEDDKHLVDPYFYPIYEEATRLNLAVAVHIANGSPQLLDQFKPRYDRMGGFAQFRIPTVITCLSLMMSDVPKTFPQLRWAFVEASAQWVPWVVKEAIRRTGTKGLSQTAVQGIQYLRHHGNQRRFRVRAALRRRGQLGHRHRLRPHRRVERSRRHRHLPRHGPGHGSDQEKDSGRQPAPALRAVTGATGRFGTFTAEART